MKLGVPCTKQWMLRGTGPYHALAMPHQPAETCWTLVLDAAAGQDEARSQFAARYTSVIEAYLQARWKGNRLKDAVPDAVQEVLLETYKAGGLLDKAQPGLPGGFRAFLFGAVRMVARRFEEGRGQGKELALPTEFEAAGIGAVDPHLSMIFDRAWANALMQQAGQRQAKNAGGDADRTQRLSLLRLRFQEGLPVRDIAERWQMPVEKVHKWYALARKEFRQALLEVMAEHQPGTEAELEARAKELFASLN